MLAPLPVDAILPEVVAALQRNGNVVLQAPTGAGKTTRVPPALLDSGMAGDGLILVLEPRRIAAQSAACRMAAERGERVGERFGYHVRFDRRASPATRVLIVTEGVLLRMLMDDAWLEKVSIVVFDEFHERNLDSDLALAILRRLQTEFRPELKLVVMSATLDPQPLADYLACPVIVSEGRLFPVDIRYLREPDRRAVPVIVAEGVTRALAETHGDLLVFLPGVGDIRRTREELDRRPRGDELAIHDLYGDLTLEQQAEVLRPATRRKVILSTNVAETSVTVEGVVAVVDSGLARGLHRDPSVGLNRLVVQRISLASADQRAGRAGRTAPGICWRLWTEHEHRFLRERDVPEIMRLDLTGPMLTLLSWGETAWDSFPWFEPPPTGAWDQAATLLQRLGAVDGRELTPLGRQLSRIPVHPRLGRLLIEGLRLGCAKRAALAAALLAERDPFVREDRPKSQHISSSDLLDRVQSIEDFQERNQHDSMVGRLHAGTTRHIVRVQEQLLRAASEAGLRYSKDDDDRGEQAFLRAVLMAFPDRVARRRERDSARGVMVGGRGVRLGEGSAVREGDLFACVDVEEVGSSEALVRQASRVEANWLLPALITTRVEVDFDAQRERVRMVRRTRYEDLVLDEKYAETPDAQADVARVLCEAAAKQLERVLPLNDESVSQFLARVRFLRQWMPQLGLPEFSPDDFRALLPRLCDGRRSFADLRSAPLLDFLRSALTSQQLAALDREAPERITVASGSRIRLEYEPGRPPILAVRIQELFGQLETPRVAGGRVAILLHLLAPNMRPQQVTDDLRGFWERAYPLVRKELRRRYPKHAWPDDPINATPERRPRRKPL